MAAGSSREIQLKCVVVGYAGTGKTCAIISHTTDFELNWGPHLYIPTLMHDFKKWGELNGTPYCMEVWDTQGQEDYNRLRPLAYPGTHVFLIFCDVSDSKERLEGIHSFWLPEVTHSCPKVPIILVGSKIDLRGHEGIETISVQEGNAMAAKRGAAKYMEISSLENQGLSELFDEAVKIGSRYKSTSKKITAKAVMEDCLIL